MRQLVGVLLLAAMMVLGGVPAVLAATAPGTQYYYIGGGTQHGPMTLDELQGLAKSRVVHRDSLVWTAGMADWLPADGVPELAASLATAFDYYVLDAGERLGPISFDALLQRIAGGQTKAADLVWKAGLADWARADSLPELADALNPAPTPPQPTPAPVNMTADTITLAPLAQTTTAAELKKSSMVFGATLGIMFHELGHAVIGEMGVPATGPEEDVADEFSALLIATALKQENLKEETPEQRRWLQDIVQYSTLIWHHMAEAYLKQGLATPWYDEHSDNANRFRNTLCLIYGSDPATYVQLAQSVDLPANTRNMCTLDYARHFKAWQTIIRPFVRDAGDGTGEPGNAAAGTPGGKVTVEFHPSATGTGQGLLPALEQSGMFEGLAQVLETGFVWPRDFTIEFTDCGVVNAYYDPQAARIRMCWEGLEFFIGTILDAEHVARH